jgi:hypothetical protein
MAADLVSSQQLAGWSQIADGLASTDVILRRQKIHDGNRSLLLYEQQVIAQSFYDRARCAFIVRISVKPSYATRNADVTCA